MTLNADELDQLTKEYLEVDAKRQEYAERCDGIKAKLRTELAVGRYDTVSGVKVAIVPQRRFNEDQMRHVLEQKGLTELLPLLMKEVVDTAKAKQHLTGSLYDECMIEAGVPKVSIA